MKFREMQVCCGAVLMLMSFSGNAGVPIMTIGSDNSNITLAPGATATITYTVSNNTNIPLTNLKFNPPLGTTIDAAATCGSSLAVGATCNIVLNFTAPSDIGKLNLGGLTACAFNGDVCSTAAARSRLNVTVAANTVETTGYIGSDEGGNSAVYPVTLADASLGAAITLTGCDLNTFGTAEGVIHFVPDGTRGYIICSAGTPGIAVFNPTDDTFVIKQDVASIRSIAVNANRYFGVGAGNLRGFSVADNTQVAGSPASFTPGNAIRVSFSQDGNNIIVLAGSNQNAGGNRVEIFNPNDLTVAGTLGGNFGNINADNNQDQPRDMIINPANGSTMGYVIKSSTFVVFNTTNGNQTNCYNSNGTGGCITNTFVPSASQEHLLGITAAGDRLIFTNPTSNTYTFVNATTGVPLSQTSFGGTTGCQVVTVAETTPNPQAYIGCANAIRVVDMSNGNLDANIPLAGSTIRGIAATANGQSVLASRDTVQRAVVVATEDNSAQNSATTVAGSVGDVGIRPVGG